MQRVAKTLSITELMTLFSTEKKAVKWLEKTRWNGEPVCPHCGGLDNIKPYKGKKFTYHHKDCRMAFTVKTGSIMHASKIPAQKWAMAIYMMLTARKGISSLQLSKELGITQKSAWFMTQRIREACDQGSFILQKEVEVDETYIGGKEKNKHQSKKLNTGRGTIGKQAVVGMRQRGGKIRAFPISETNKETLQKAINENIDMNATVYTDEHGGYKGMSHRHEVVNHSAKEYVNGMAHTNGIESVWALLKRGYNGTFHNFSSKHLHRYINEFSFRLNEGNVEIDTIDRMKSLSANMGNKRLSYKDLIQ